MRRINPSDKQANKPKCRKRLWSPDEDERLRSYILKHGHGCWTSLPIKSGLQRNGKSCRLRWVNYLKPGLKRGMFTPQEEDTILTLHRTFGSKWSQIAHHLPGRTDNDVKNHWHSYLKNKKLKSEIIEAKDAPQIEPSTINSVTRVSSFESFSSGEGSQVAFEKRQSLLPRLLFAEWLKMDNEHYNYHQLVHTNPNETFSLNSLYSETQGNNAYNQDTSSSMSNSSGNEYDNVEKNVVGNVSNELDIKDGGEQDHDNLAFVESIFEDEIYNDFFGSYDLKHLQN